MDKNNFLMYKDFKSSIDILTDEQAGKLIKAVFNYVNGRIEPDFKDGMLKMAFNILKTQLERDLESYKKRVKASQENGKLGGRPPKEDKPNKPTRLKKTKLVAPKPRKGDSVSVSDKDSVNGIDKENIKEVSLLETAIEDFIKFRKKIKNAMTDKAIELLKIELSKLTDNDTDKIAIIEQSILNGWKGVFPLKTNGYTKETPTLDINDF